MVRKRDNLYAAERQFLLKEISLPEDCKNSEGERVKVQALVSFFSVLLLVVKAQKAMKCMDLLRW